MSIEGQQLPTKEPIKYTIMGSAEGKIEVNEQGELYLCSCRIGEIKGLGDQETEGQGTVPGLEDVKKVSFRNNLVRKVEGMERLSNVEELEMYDNKVKKIEGIAHMTKMRILDFSYNNVKKIEGLDTLTEIETLYLVSNRISKIENLENKLKLKSLELSANKIEKIENIENFPNLTELFLNRNRIEVIENLNAVPNLIMLGLSVLTLLILRQTELRRSKIYLHSNASRNCIWLRIRLQKLRILNLILS